MQVVLFTVLGACVMVIGYALGIPGPVDAILFLGGVFTGALLRVSRPIIDRWNGSAWQVLVAPTTGSGSAFNGMSVLSDTSVWAGGSYAQAGTNSPLLEQYAPGPS